MATTIEQQVALDEALVPSAQRSPFFKAFLVTADVPEIYMQEFWATAKVRQDSIRFKMDTKKHIVDLEAFREMLHISPRVSGQSFAELPFEEEILEFLRFRHSAQIKTLTYRQHQNQRRVPERKKGGSASSTTPPTHIATPTPTTTVVAAPRLSAAAKGKQPARATSHTDPSDVERTEAEQLKIVLRRSRQDTHISQQRGSSTNEGTGSKPRVPDVPSDDSKEEISWNSSDDEDVDDQTKGSDDKEGEKTDESDDDNDDQEETEKVNDDDNDEEEISKINEQEATESDEGDDEETKKSEDDGNGEEDQGLRISEEERMHEEEEADELYRNVDINQGRGLQVSQDIEDFHVTLTPTHSDGQQESSSTSSFVTNLLNPIIVPGMESIFTTGSSTVTPIPSPKSTMTPSIITTTTTASQPPIPLTPIPSDVLQTLLTFESVFRFEDRVKSLEVNFSEFMRTNQSTEAVSNIPGLVHQYIHQEMTEAVREAVQIQTDRLQYSLQRENDEFLRTIDDNMKKIIKEQVKSQLKAQVTRILPRIKEFVNAQLEAEVLTRSSHSSRTSYAMAADLLEMELKKILIDKMEGNKSIQRSDEQRNLYKALVEAYDADKTILDSYGESTILKRRREDDDDQEGPSTGSDRGSKRRREGGEYASASTPSKPATESAGRSTTGTQSRQLSASESAFAEEPVQTTCQMEEPSHLVFETSAGDQPIVQTSQHPEWFSQPRKLPTPNRDWNKTLPAPLPLIPDNQSRRVIPFEHFINNDLEYLWGGASSQKYIISITKTKAADYGHIKWIEDLVPRTMTVDTTIEQQAAIDEALIPHAQRLRIGRSNFRLLLDIKSKESTLQLVYDVLRICPFFKAFLIVFIHNNHAIRFKMDNKKHIMNLESFRDMLHICLRVHGQSFDEPPFEEEILAFIHFLRHGAAIRTLTDGLYHKRNVGYAYLMWEDFIYQVEHKNHKKSNEMYYPWLTKVIIHHFMSKDLSIPRRNKVNWHYVRDDHMFSTIKLVSIHQNTQQFGALLLIELTNKKIKNSNAYKEYYAIATGAAPPKPKDSVRRTRSSFDTSITPPITVAGPRLTTFQKGKQVAKASKAKSLSALSEVAMTEAQQLKLVTKRSRQQTHISHASSFGADDGTGSIPGVPDVPTNESEEELSWNSTNDEGADDEGKDGDDDEEDEGNDGKEGDGDDDDKDDDGEEGNDDDDDQEVEKDDEEEGGDDEQEYNNDEFDEETRDEERFDPILQTPKNSDDEGNGDEDLGINVGGEEDVEEEDEDKLYKDVNINQGRGLQMTLDVEDSHVILTPVNPDGMESIFETTSQMDAQTPTSVAPIPMTAPTMTPSTIATITTTSQAPILPTTVPSTIIQNLPNFGSLFRFDDRLRATPRLILMKKVIGIVVALGT
nr:hypothetical protein [Tanacetum cinerariifolium]